MKTILIFVVVVCNSCFSYSQKWHDFSQWSTTPSNIKYYIVDSGIGSKLKDEDVVFIKFIWYSEADKNVLFSNCDKTQEPQKVLLGNNYYVKGFQEALSLLKKKGKGYFIIPPSLAYGKEGLDGEKTLFYYIEIIEVKKE